MCITRAPPRFQTKTVAVERGFFRAGPANAGPKQPRFCSRRKASLVRNDKKCPAHIETASQGMNSPTKWPTHCRSPSRLARTVVLVFPTLDRIGLPERTPPPWPFVQALRPRQWLLPSVRTSDICCSGGWGGLRPSKCLDRFQTMVFLIKFYILFLLASCS